MKFENFKDFIDLLSSYAALLIPIVFGLCFLAFFWGTGKFIHLSGTNPDELPNARNYLIYGILGLFVIISIWGIVFVLADLIGLHSL